ncbi:MAG: hypothetical protein OHK0039_02550 [Bacteroidia bacterium]
MLADTKTLIFSNNKNTVKGYIYAQLEEYSACCGSDRIYLEVKIDPSGYVLSVTPLTGKNDCMKQSAADILKNVKWDASEFKGPKSIYIEIKPEIECTDGRDNAYRAIPIFNNEKLNGGGQVAAVQTQTQTQPVVQPQPTTTQPQTTEPQTPSRGEPETSQPVVSTPPQTQPVVTTQPEPAPVRPSTQVQPQQVAANNTFLPTQPPTGNTPELDEARRRAEAERIAQEQEIQRLREEMARLRNEEERRQQARLAQEQRQREREAALAQRDPGTEQATNRNRRNNPQNSEGDMGGLFLDDSAPAPGGPDSTTQGEDRTRQEIAQLEARLRQLEDQQRQREEEERRRQDESQQTRMEMLRITEEIAMKNEEAARLREQRELDQLEADRNRVETERRTQEEQYQRLMDEIRRLQDEAQQKIADLERQKGDMSRMAELKKAREQEIILERALREKERERMLEEKRISLMGRGATTVANSGTDIDALMASLGDVSTEVDSEKLLILVRTIEQMRAEMQILQIRIQQLEAGEPVTPAPATSGAANRNPQQSRPAGTYTRADQDKSWQGLDIQAPGTTPKDYVSPERPAAGTPQPSGQSTRPTASDAARATHKDTHWDGPGPEFGPRTPVGGESQMKDLIKTKLRSGGVCGLGQAAFSLTLDPQGNVIRHSVLAANTPQVEAQMATILPTLKFDATNSRYNQTVYFQFKAEIICEGQSTNVQLQNVEQIIKD